MGLPNLKKILFPGLNEGAFSLFHFSLFHFRFFCFSLFHFRFLCFSLSHLVILAFFALNSSQAFSESVEAKLGLEQTSVISTTYQGKTQSTLQAEATYSKEFVGRWSIFAQYQTNSKNTLSAGVLGVQYDSADIRSKGGTIYNDGGAEIIKSPIWMFRSSFGLGLFKYVDVLKSNNRNLGTLNDKPVQADMYGLKFSGSLIRFFRPDLGASFSFSYGVASASGFGISTSSFNFGVFYVMLK